jgi:hypothetical protein
MQRHEKTDPIQKPCVGEVALCGYLKESTHRRILLLFPYSYNDGAHLIEANHRVVKISTGQP